MTVLRIVFVAATVAGAGHVDLPGPPVNGHDEPVPRALKEDAADPAVHLDFVLHLGRL